MTLSLHKQVSQDNSSNISNLIDILIQRAETKPHQVAYTFLQDGETEEVNLTYQELDQRARAVAASLKVFCQPGDRALLLYPSGLDFIEAFFGCLYAGVVAVPAYPPKRNQKLSRLLSIANDSQAKIALTTTSILTDIDRRREKELDLLNQPSQGA